MHVENNQLHVIEVAGEARSGKGSIVIDAAERNNGVAAEETGADYRVVTHTLLGRNAIKPGMSPDEVVAAAEQLGGDEIADIVAGRNSLVARHGLPTLYTPEVNNLVAVVAPATTVRQAVKAGFRRRVEAIRDDPNYHTLIIDGRNLEPVIRNIPDTRLVLRLFVTCDNSEATLRECTRNGISPDSDEARAIFMDIRRRNIADATRSVDPSKPDENAIDYWDQPRDAVARSVGGVSLRQIVFDTTPFRFSPKPKEAMLQAARRIYAAALQEPSTFQSTHSA